jgi:acyl-coenzyme A thioesterase PaaI-like protein
VQRLGQAIVTRAIEPSQAAQVAARLDAIRAELETGPPQAKIDAMRGATSGHQRIEQFVATGRWPPPLPDGASIPFDALSYVGGELHPFSIGARYQRDGDQAVATVTFSAAYEGPPRRAHGGAVASVFDEVMSSVFRALGRASAFTGTLTVRFEAPAPLDVEVEFRAWLASSQGRKQRVEAVAAGPGGRFASAEGTFVELPAESYAQLLAPPADQASPLTGTGSGAQSGNGA